MMNKLRIILTLSILIKVGEPAIIKAVVYLKSTDSECSISLKSGRSDNIIIDMI
jgi:hypothetical protein